MTKQKSTEIVANDPVDRKGELKRVGGSTSDAFNNILANSVIQTLWIKNSNAEAQSKQFTAAVAALTGIAPQDELEGMLAGSSSPQTPQPWSATGARCTTSRPSKVGRKT